MAQHAAFGPPGTGKTTFGIEISRWWLTSGGLSGREIAYLAFTRQAALEALGRAIDASPGGNEEDYPYFRTIHSLCYRGLREASKWGKRVLTPTDMRRFSQEVGWKANFAICDWEDVVTRDDSVAVQTMWDKANMAYQISRISATSIQDLEAARYRLSKSAASSIGRLDEDVYRTFVRKYEDFKDRNGLVDFTDMLEYGLVAMPPLDGVRVVVVDEAQDLAPIHYAIVDRLFRSAGEIWWIGDDDQAIYRFAGAKADLFLDRARRADRRILLRRTHRFGDGIVGFSRKIISRVDDRQEKDLITDREGGTVYTTGSFRPVAGKTLVLHRHVSGCQEIAKRYMAAGIPFRNERGKDPLSAGKRIKAWKAINALAKGEKASIHGVSALFEDVMPSVHMEEGKPPQRLVVHGGKAKIAQSTEKHVSLDEMVLHGILTPDGASAIKERSYEMMKHSEDLLYYQRVVDNGYSLDGEPQAVISTIHAKKGAQADHVVVFAEMSRRCWDDRDTEHRLAYVAATRTRGDLEICVERTVEWARSRYEYPV
jgi:superfamily I DNA/RNA helicase